MEQCKSKCPVCENLINPEKVQNLGFYNCVYSLDGMRTDNTTIEVKDARTELNKFITFEEGESHRCDWRYLNITCREL